MYILMTRKTAYDLLCKVLTPHADFDDSFLSPDDPIWSLIFNLADSNFALPELRQALIDKGLQHCVPKNMWDNLETVSQLIASRCSDIRDQIREINVILHNIGITSVWLKGAALLTETQGLQQFRIMSDIDLWIPAQEQQTEALIALGRIGYSAKPEAALRDWSGSHHYAPMEHPERPVSLELHRHIVRPAFAELLSNNDARSRLIMTTFDGIPIAHLALVDRIMHSLIQCSLMSTPQIETGQIRLMKVMDLIRLLSRENSFTIPSQVVDVITISKWRKPLERFLTLLERDFKVPNPLDTDTEYCRALDYLLLHGRFSPKVISRLMLRPPDDWWKFISQPSMWRQKILNRFHAGAR
jgi:hypothetical protein